MLTYALELAEAEARLVDALRDVAYGEIYGIQVEPGERNRLYRLSAAERSLIFEIRDGLTSISVLHIHDNQPVYAEVDEKIGGFHCRRKIKFPSG